MQNKPSEFSRERLLLYGSLPLSDDGLTQVGRSRLGEQEFHRTDYFYNAGKNAGED